MDVASRSKPKVNKLNVHIIVNHYVVKLDVSVCDILLMNMLKSAQDLFYQKSSYFFTKGCILIANVKEKHALDILHDHKWNSRWHWTIVRKRHFSIVASFVHFYNILMIQTCKCLNFIINNLSCIRILLYPLAVINLYRNFNSWVAKALAQVNFRSGTGT